MDNLLLSIGGKDLYFDIDALSEKIRIEPLNTMTDETCKDTISDLVNEHNEEIDELSLQIDVAKYEMYREMVATVLQNSEEIDDKLGLHGLNQASIPFKMAFNTLVMKGIIREL